MSMTTETLPLLGRCANCEFALRATDDEAQEVERYRDMNDVSVPYRMGANVYVRCPQRHKPFKLFRIQGEFSDKFQCDARCENAKGHECKCSCGGMNHGLGHIRAVERVEPLRAPSGRTDAAVATAMEAQVRDDEAQVEGEPEDSDDRDFMGEKGEEISGFARVTWTKDITDKTIYLFRASEDGDEWPWTLKWFAPSFLNTDYAVGDEMEFTAKVLDHQDDLRYGQATIVTYFKEIEGE